MDVWKSVAVGVAVLVAVLVATESLYVVTHHEHPLRERATDPDNQSLQGRT